MCNAERRQWTPTESLILNYCHSYVGSRSNSFIMTLHGYTIHCANSNILEVIIAIKTTHGTAIGDASQFAVKATQPAELPYPITSTSTESRVHLSSPNINDLPKIQPHTPSQTPPCWGIQVQVIMVAVVDMVLLSGSTLPNSIASRRFEACARARIVPTVSTVFLDNHSTATALSSNSSMAAAS